MTLIFYYMIHLLKSAVGASNLLLIALSDIIGTLYFKIVLILLLLEARDIERNPEPNTINNPLSILHCNI